MEYDPQISRHSVFPIVMVIKMEEIFQKLTIGIFQKLTIQRFRIQILISSFF